MSSTTPPSPPSSPFARLSYATRAPSFPNPTARRLLSLASSKRTNLCLSVDVTSTQLLLDIADAAGPYICALKTHADIVEDFDFETTVGGEKGLKAVAEKNGFVIFEDRKFADIGNTVHLQYSSGIHHISSWADFVTAHSVPGPGIVSGLAKAAKPLGRGVILLAEMSSKGNLCDEMYRKKTWEMARENRDVVVGFIGMQRYFESASDSAPDSAAESDATDFLYLTPGVSLTASSDGLGQQYRTPEDVVETSGCDFIIVGRGIYAGVEEHLDGGVLSEKGKEMIRRRCEEYRKRGWDAYERRIGKL
ncbi:orotidine-5'-monophosphate decarboxylase [Gonapodya prolifera JEL478]|uniref:Orotidine 5'-phosphate decarboxylase n=1 Tax=Gonapodya prolifera (strain JEL478) TaxID=1344416 RepID=A0A139AD96_GONPJ|nr:orotidine-5'-monophosphate decarboxylase [Gonapodya prolifera JEL478]|eukprot:KXS14415.1 orotidine-5'-monophosphate decarboxylase [Gonapodya prolifera JEL478]